MSTMCRHRAGRSSAVAGVSYLINAPPLLLALRSVRALFGGVYSDLGTLPSVGVEPSARFGV